MKRDEKMFYLQYASPALMTTAAGISLHLTHFLETLINQSKKRCVVSYNYIYKYKTYTARYRNGTTHLRIIIQRTLHEEVRQN